MMLGPFALLMVAVLLAQPDRADPALATPGQPGQHGAATASGMPGTVKHTGMWMPSAAGTSFAARAAVLPTRGWTARASAAVRGHRASAAIDGRRTTTWITPVGARAPHVLTLDTRAPRTLSGLRYTPEAGRSARRLGTYTVQVSSDGRRWSTVASGRFGTDATVKTVTFRAVAARYARLRASNAAGPRRAVAVAEVALLGGPLNSPLDRSDWRVAADSQDPGKAPGLAVDGDPETFWHTVVDDVPAPMLPHAIVLDTGAASRIAALGYTPRQDGRASGRIGGFVVQVSDDGVTYRRVASGTWADDATTKTVQFSPTTARYVRLRATSEAGGRGPWTSAAEINLYGPPGGPAPVADPGTLGSWGPVIGLPIVPTTAILLPGDKVLTMSAAFATDYDIDQTDVTQFSIVDVSQRDGGRPGQREVTDVGHQMFCTGLSVLADGRVLITGGSSSSNSTLYDPREDDPTKAFTVAPQMAVPRGYQTSVTLSNGGVFTIGGSWSGGEHVKGGSFKNGEVLDAGAASWRFLSGTSNDAILTDDGDGTYRADNHAWLFSAAGGRVFQAGPSDQMNWFETTGAGSTVSAGVRGDAEDAMNGNAVMYDAGKILTLGGAKAYGYVDPATGTNPVAATRSARTVDVSGTVPGGPVKAPVVVRQGDMAKARGFLNSVVLPDGTVLATGGQSTVAPFTDTDAQLSAELWSPEARGFRTLAAESVPRTYHSFSLLLQDGRVLTGGGGLTPNSEINHPDMQIFTPPYLLEKDGARRVQPVISSAPATAAAGTVMRVTTDRPVAKWAMVRVGTSTHSINSDQRRFVPVATRVGTSNSYDLTVPADRGVSIPGPYLLFALDSRGTPSRAAWVTVPL